MNVSRTRRGIRPSQTDGNRARACSLSALVLCVAAIASASTSRWAAAAAPRVTADLQVLYTFERPPGDEIHDRSEVAPPLDLTIDKPDAVQWRGGHASVVSSVRIQSKTPAKKLIDAVKKSNELTIEAWLEPIDARQAGPARIVSLSADPSHRDVTLGQDGGRYDVRLRTASTSANGLPSTSSPENSLRAERTHFVFTRDRAGTAMIFINGKQTASGKVAGDLANWDDKFSLLLANEATGDRPWLGDLHLVAIYSRALSDKEVATNFQAGVAPSVDYAALLPPAADRQVDFVKDVQPILRERCFECHSRGNEEGGLNLGVRARVMEGGEHGPVLFKGDSATSPLVHLVASLDKDRLMPPEGDRLTKEQIGVLRGWIDQGAVWPAGADVLDPRVQRAREHWAFQPLNAVAAPPVADGGWARTPVDRFILAGLEENNLRPAPPAEPAELIRRAYFDVVGLPPTPAEVDAFCEASKKDPQAALEKLVDQLLDSPRYGERWAQHWLDVARYADSDGQEADRDRPNAFHYRDFVIRSLNDDLPFDTFLRWQLAGDEYEPQNPAAVAATGFLTAGPHTVLENTFLEEERLRNRYNELDDMLSTIGTGMLGLTIGCARCHDHKYDAISSREYYRLLSALHSGDRAEVPIGGDGKALAFRDFGDQPAATWLFGRGDFYDRDQPVQLGFLAVLTDGKTAEDFWDEARRQRPLTGSTYQRKALAQWITDVQHGAGALAARVIVNRLWQHHFGEGLARTPSDFGVRGQPPTHPDLLDWLTHDFVQHGWKLKRLHRLMLTSAAYQQAATFDPSAAKVDPENRLLWRMRPRRLEAEAIRDAMLAVGGTLNDEAFGPAFKAPVAAEAMVARNLQGEPYPANIQDGPANHRRSVYMFRKRVIPYPLLQAFDQPDSLQSCGRRLDTTVAPQALAMLNDGFVRRRATDFADRLLREAGDDQIRQIDRAFALALARQPTEIERAACAQFLTAQRSRRAQRDPKIADGDARRLALADLCQSLFGLNEFIYID